MSEEEEEGQKVGCDPAIEQNTQRNDVVVKIGLVGDAQVRLKLFRSNHVSRMVNVKMLWMIDYSGLLTAASFNTLKDYGANQYAKDNSKMVQWIMQIYISILLHYRSRIHLSINLFIHLFSNPPIHLHNNQISALYL